uniref:Tig_1 protein n=1 Tax=Fopius arisanus TaxID=64838 RepID=A0A0C9RIE0_9HYME
MYVSKKQQFITASLVSRSTLVSSIDLQSNIQATQLALRNARSEFECRWSFDLLVRVASYAFRRHTHHRPQRYLAFMQFFQHQKLQLEQMWIHNVGDFLADEISQSQQILDVVPARSAAIHNLFSNIVGCIIAQPMAIIRRSHIYQHRNCFTTKRCIKGSHAREELRFEHNVTT